MNVKCPVCGTDKPKHGSSSHAEGPHNIFISFTCGKCGGDINTTIFKNGDEIESMEIKYNKNKQNNNTNRTFA